MSALIKPLIGLYSLVNKTGLMETAWFKKFFRASYFFYKKHIEDPFYHLGRKRPDLFQGGMILDIGANIGYTSLVFARLASPGSRVYAFEPDAKNFEQLQNTIQAYGLPTRVVPVCSAVGEKKGTIQFWHNPDHHGDHRVLTDPFKASGNREKQSSSVPLTSIDDFLEELQAESGGTESVKFIKIDVQGYELPVFLGMQKMLKANPRAVVAFEYMPETLVELGFEPEQLIRFFQDRGYSMFVLHQDGALEPFRSADLSQRIQARGYIDFICHL